MTWQGAGGAGGPDGTPGQPDDATRTDWNGGPPPVPQSAADVPDPFAPGGPLAEDVPAPVGAPPPAAPPAAPPVAPPPVAPPPFTPSAVAPGGTPWAAPVEGSGSWGTPPPGDQFAVPGAPGLVYAGAVPRAAAWLIDSFLLGIVIGIVTIPFAAAAVTLPTDPNVPFDPSTIAARTGIASIIGVVIEAAYFIPLWTSGARATLGMRLLKLQVGNFADGARLQLDQAVKRWLAYGSVLGLVAFVPGLAPLAGLAQLALTIVLLLTTITSPTKQGLHDKFAGSAVVRPASAGNGLAIACLVVALILPLLAIISLVGLFLLGGQVSSILSTVGESV